MDVQGVVPVRKLEIKHSAFLFKIIFLKKKELHSFRSLFRRVSILKQKILKPAFGNKHLKLIMSVGLLSFSH